MSSRASATKCAPHIKKRNATVQMYGRRGIWFDRAVARCMAIEIKRLRLFKSKSAILDAAIGRRESAGLKLDRALDESEREVERLRYGLKAQIARNEKLERKAKRRTRRAYLASGVLVVLGAIAAGLILGEKL